MKASFPRCSRIALALALCMLASSSAWSQPGASLSGTVTTPSGEAVPRARISAKNLNTGQTTETQADSAGHFDFSASAPASFEITISADGYSPKVLQVTFAPGTLQTVTLTLTAIPGWTWRPQ